MKLTIDYIACDGAGLCAELLPELISRDEWGYPIANLAKDATVAPELTRPARDAVALCPKLALRLT
jgi:ferredoxin